MSDSKIKLPEQDFLSVKDYVQSKLVPAVSKLEDVVRGIFSSSQVELTTRVQDRNSGYAFLCVPYVSPVCRSELNLDGYPESKSDKIRKCLISFTAKSIGQSTFALKNSHGNIIEKSYVDVDNQDYKDYSLYLELNSDTYFLVAESKLGSVPVCRDFSIKIVYV